MTSLKYVKQEFFNPDYMRLLLNHDGLSYETKQQLKKYYKRRQAGNRVDTIYDYAKEYSTYQIGRVYAINALSLQSFERDIRNALAQGVYWDIDMVNAHPTILLQACKSKGWACNELEHYVNNRDEVLGDIVKHYGCSTKDAKNLMIRMMFLGHPEAWIGDSVCENSTNHFPFVNAFRQELENIANNVYNNEKDISDVVAKKRKKNITQKKSCVLSLFLQSEEHKILIAIDKSLQTQGRLMDTFIFDGGLVRKLKDEIEFPNDILQQCEQDVKQKTGYEVKLSVKPLETSFEIQETVNEYDTMKQEFETTHFKVMRPLMYVEQLNDGDYYIREPTELKNAYLNKMCNGVEFIDTWIKDPYIRTYDKMDFLPPPLQCPSNVFNMWQGFAIEHTDVVSSGNIQPFIDHTNIMVNHDDNGREYWLNILAQMLKEPGYLPGIAIVFKSSQGAGKNIYLELFNQILGKDLFYETVNPVQDLMSRFSVGRKNRILINVDETNSKDTYSYSDQLKNYITSPHYNYEQKGVSPITLRNFNRFFFTTNNSCPIRIEDGDRRFVVFECSNEMKGNTQYFKDFAKYINDPSNQKAVYEYLLNRDISGVDWINDRPFTELYNDIKEANSPIHIKFFKWLVENNSMEMKLKYSGQSFFDGFNEFITKGNFKNSTMTITAWGRLMKKLVVCDGNDEGFIKKVRGNYGWSYKFSIQELNDWLISHNHIQECLITNE
jgi:hypothetical protein